MSEPVKRRIHELDLLRGFFILVIIIDHLQFWPSPLTFLTGEGRLWVSAAEGFFLISGLLIGYIRGYKGRNQPLAFISKKLAYRAFMLYAWGVGITFAVTGFTLLVGAHPLLPKLPAAEQLTSPLIFIQAVLSTNFFNDWIYYLRLYAIMLLATPLFLWMLRNNYWRVLIAIIIGAYITSFAWPEGALQWQVLFFGAGLIGYKLEDIIAYMRSHPRFKNVFITANLIFMFSTMIISFFFVHGWVLVETPANTIMTRDNYVAIRTVVDPIFSDNPMMPGRIMLAFIWFTGALALTHVLRRYLLKYLGWLLIPLGERSLSAYCLQAILLSLVVITIPISTYPLVNGIVALGVVLMCWGLLQLRPVQKLLPR